MTHTTTHSAACHSRKVCSPSPTLEPEIKANINAVLDTLEPGFSLGKGVTVVTAVIELKAHNLSDPQINALLAGRRLEMPTRMR